MSVITLSCFAVSSGRKDNSDDLSSYSLCLKELCCYMVLGRLKKIGWESLSSYTGFLKTAREKAFVGDRSQQEVICKRHIRHGARSAHTMSSLQRMHLGKIDGYVACACLVPMSQDGARAA